MEGITMKKARRTVVFILLALACLTPLKAHWFSNLECEALEYAIDDAFTTGQHELADTLFGIYVNGGCWPYEAY
jgi:hypothetical protein